MRVLGEQTRIGLPWKTNQRCSLVFMGSNASHFLAAVCCPACALLASGTPTQRFIGPQSCEIRSICFVPEQHHLVSLMILVSAPGAKYNEERANKYEKSARSFHFSRFGSNASGAVSKRVRALSKTIFKKSREEHTRWSRRILRPGRHPDSSWTVQGFAEEALHFTEKIRFGCISKSCSLIVQEFIAIGAPPSTAVSRGDDL